MQEFTDFLAGQPPFDALGADELQRLAAQIKVAYFPRGAVIVTEGGPVLTQMWMIRTGAVEVLAGARIIDLLTVGDTFGHVSMLSGSSPALTVRAVEDTVCYQLPDLRTVLERPEALQFAKFGSVVGAGRLTVRGSLGAGQNPVEKYLRRVVWCQPTDSVATAAAAITAADSSCVLVELPSGQVGIATDRDFRSKVATGEIGLDAPISALTATPVESINLRTSVAAASIRMVEAGVHHLAVLDDTGRPIGIIRTIDLGSVEVRDPLLVRSAIEMATDVDGLITAGALITPTVIELHDNDVPPLRIAELMTAVTESLLRRLLELSAHPSGDQVDISWMVLGSLARREPLPASDVDTAIMWVTAPGHQDPADLLRARASDILDLMERCGLRRCPDGANADNPLFSRSRATWIASAGKWVSNPSQDGALLLSSIIADSRPITRPVLGRAITDTLKATTQTLDFRDSLLRFITAARPPVGFVRDFVVEHSGEHRGGFDLKRGGLRPITSLARGLALVSGDVRGGSIDRIDRAAGQGLLTRGEADTLIRAFDDIYGLTYQREISALKTGRTATTWVTPGELDDLTRRHLRESFRAVSTIQTTVVNKWRERIPS